MSKDDEQKLHRAKAWCLDKGVSIEQMQAAWNNAVEANNHIVCNLNSHGYEWWWLPEHLLEQLLDRYSMN